jgi:hypothetical protein
METGYLHCKIITAVINTALQNFSVLVKVSYFHDSYIFAGKAGANPSKATYWAPLLMWALILTLNIRLPRKLLAVQINSSYLVRVDPFYSIG